MAVICPVCHHENIEGLLHCRACGAPLAKPGESITARVESELPVEAAASQARGSPRLERSARLLLYFDKQGQGVEIDLWELESVLLGRFDPEDKTTTPKIDLTPYGGQLLGVSRRHARLDLNDGMVYISDLQSTNGTFANSRPLNPAQPQRLCDGDEVMLGRLGFRVLFQTPDALD